MKPKTRRQYINGIAKILQCSVPPAFPVRVWQTDLPPNEFGDCSVVMDGDNSHFLIRLRKEMSNDLILFVLAHEWGHTLSWTMEHQDFIKAHDAEWGVAYARCWKALSGSE